MGLDFVTTRFEFNVKYIEIKKYCKTNFYSIYIKFQRIYIKIVDYCLFITGSF